MPLARRRFAILGAETPLGASLALALGLAGARAVAEGPLDILIEASPLPPLGALADGMTPIRLAQAVGPLADLADEAERVERGGVLLLVASHPPPAPTGWPALMLDWRRAYVAAMSREMAARGVRVNGLVATTEGARLPGFLKGAALSTGLATEREVVDAALWLLAARSVTGRTLELGPG